MNHKGTILGGDDDDKIYCQSRLNYLEDPTCIISGGKGDDYIEAGPGYHIIGTTDYPEFGKDTIVTSGKSEIELKDGGDTITILEEDDEKKEIKIFNTAAWGRTKISSAIWNNPANRIKFTDE